MLSLIPPLGNEVTSVRFAPDAEAVILSSIQWELLHPRLHEVIDERCSRYCRIWRSVGVARWEGAGQERKIGLRYLRLREVGWLIGEWEGYKVQCAVDQPVIREADLHWLVDVDHVNLVVP